MVVELFIKANKKPLQQCKGFFMPFNSLGKLPLLIIFVFIVKMHYETNFLKPSSE